MNDKDGDVDLRIGGKVFSRLCFDTALTLEVLEKNSRTTIRTGGRINIERHEGQLSLSGENPMEATQAWLLIGKQ